MQAFDSQIIKWLKSVGLNVTFPSNAPEPFHVVASPPPPGFPIVEVVRPSKDSEFYVIAMGVAIHPEHRSALSSMPEEKRKQLLLELKTKLLMLKVDFAFLPPDSKVPETVQVSKIFFPSITAHEFFDFFYAVRNAGLMVMMTFADLLPSGKQSLTYV